MVCFNLNFFKFLSRTNLLFTIVIIVFIVLNLKKDNKIIVPVAKATNDDWDPKSFWFYPWNDFKIHKGIDIFAPLGTPVISPVNGFIIESDYSDNGGNYIYILSADLKIYYFAHLDTKTVSAFSFVKIKDQIGTVGDTGNARYSPFHLHFSIFSIIPVLKNWDHKSRDGWQKIFYLNPNTFLPET